MNRPFTWVHTNVAISHSSSTPLPSQCSRWLSHEGGTRLQAGWLQAKHQQKRKALQVSGT